jgi:hypothetical protein
MVKEGRLLFSMASEPRLEMELTRETGAQAIPPDIEHEVRPVGPCRFSIDFLTVDRTVGADEGAGGDPACWAGLICPECGAVTADGYHRPGCSAASRSEEGDAATSRRRVEPGRDT